MSSSQKVLVYGSNGGSSPCHYELCADYNDHVSATASNDEIWVASESSPMTPVTGISSGVLNELARCIDKTKCDVLSSGTSISVCTQVGNNTLNIVDTFPNEGDAGSETQKLIYFHKLSLPSCSTVRKISCGDSHCLVLCDTSCFSCGTNAYGELGIGTRSEYSNVIQSVHLSPNLPVSDISAGNNYSALVTQSGQVYTFGNGAYFKLGHGDDEDRLVPTRVVALDSVGEFQSDGTFAGVKYIACGRWHTVVVTHATNDVYGWGWNKFGNLGANPTTIRSDVESAHQEEIVALPRRIEDLDSDHLLGDGASGETIHLHYYCCLKIDLFSVVFFFFNAHAADASNDGQQVIKVTCGSRHTALLTATGKVIVM